MTYEFCMSWLCALGIEQLWEEHECRQNNLSYTVSRTSSVGECYFGSKMSHYSLTAMLHLAWRWLLFKFEVRFLFINLFCLFVNVIQLYIYIFFILSGNVLLLKLLLNFQGNLLVCLVDASHFKSDKSLKTWVHKNVGNKMILVHVIFPNALYKWHAGMQHLLWTEPFCDTENTRSWAASV